MRKLLTVLAVLVLLFSVNVGPTTAWTHTGGWFSGINVIQDYELKVCHEAGWVYDHRHRLNEGARKWSNVYSPQLTFTSLGSSTSGCNIHFKLMTWAQDCGYQTPALMQTSDINGGYSYISIFVNHLCPWYWGSTLPVPNTHYDALTVAAHEVGHALGVHHSVSGTLMAPTVSASCGDGDRLNKMASDDAAGARARYPGLGQSSVIFPSQISCFD